MIRRFASLLAPVLLTASARAADDKPVKPPAVPKVQAPKVQAIPRPPAAARPNAGAMGGGRAAAPGAHPGEEVLDRLLKQTPEQRERALQGLPEARRTNLERRIAEIQKLPTAALNVNLERLRRLNGLQQPRQGQVRRSINQFAALPEDRRTQMSHEIQRISSLPDEDRRAYMNTEEFRNRYSANEQQIMSNIAEVTPEVPPKE